MLDPQETGLPTSFLPLPVENLTKPTLDIYQALLEVAYTVSDRRGYKATPNQVCFFCPSEIVAYALGIGRTTLYRHLKLLKTAGLVDQRGHMTDCNGSTRCDGSLWAINLKPETSYQAKLKIEDFDYEYRDLAADIDNGKTAYAFIQEMKQSYTDKEQWVNSDLILDWIPLPPTAESTVLSMTVPSLDLEQILDIPQVDKRERNEVIDQVAETCAMRLADTSNINFYRWLLWQALRLYWQKEDVFFALYQALRRVQIDQREGYALKPGALFVSRLKQMEMWERLKAVPQTRVGSTPKQTPLEITGHLNDL